VDEPVVEALEAAEYTVPTEWPEADSTLAWDATTLVLVHARSGATAGLGSTTTYASRGSSSRASWTVLDSAGGSLRPGADGAPGHCLTLRTDAAERYRTA
jgi:hypothetical protein